MIDEHEDRITRLERQVSELTNFCIAQNKLQTLYYAMAIKASCNIDTLKNFNELFAEQFAINKNDLSTAYSALSTVYKEQFLKTISDFDPNQATTLKNIIDSES